MSEGWAGKRVLVVGLGVSGFAAARALLELDAKVRVTEASSGDAIAKRAAELAVLGAEVETGGHDLEALEADIAVVSPGIFPSSDVVKALSAARVRIIGEVELAFRLARCDFLAVTGTNGKTTTTSLLASMLAHSGIPSAAAGNIGDPLVDAARAIPQGGAVAVEVSSFQLATIESFRPKVAVVLNVAEDHTDWHGTYQSYASAKARIFTNQTSDDVAIVNADDPGSADIARGARARVIPFSGHRLPPGGAGVEGEMIVIEGEGIVPVNEVPLPGVAGIEDAVAAAAAAILYGVDAGSVRRALGSFRPLAHRMTTVGEIDGVTYIDDSKATNPHATVAAVRGMTDVVLIAGGRSKGIDLGPLAQLVPPVIAVVALGEARSELEQVFSGLVPVDRVDSMEDAIRSARVRANGKGSVLLSPACASLDMYTSYAARGDAFAEAVRKLSSRERGVDGHS